MLALRSGASRYAVNDLAFSPDGRWLVAPCRSAGVAVWPVPPGGPKAARPKLPVRSAERVGFAAAGGRFCVGHDQLCIVDPDGGEPLPVPIRPWGPLRFGLTPDGGHLFVAENPMGTENTRLTRWAVGAAVEPAGELVFPTMVYSPLLFHPPSDSFLLIEANRGPFRQWEFRRVRRSAATGEELGRSEALEEYPEETIVSADGRLMACRTRDAIRIYPAAGGWDGQNLPTVRNDSLKHFTGVAFHPSGRFLAATSNDTTVKLYEAGSWRLAKTFTWDVGRLRSVAFSPDGSLAAVGGDGGKVVVWDVDL